MVVLTARCSRRLAALALLLAAFACVAFADEGSGVSEYGVKAAFLTKFPGYVEWPAPAFAAGAPIAIGVVESDAMADELARIAGAHAQGGRAVTVRRLRRTDPIEGLDVLFVGRAAEPALPSLLHAARGQPVLVVTESDTGLAAGGMINFVVVDSKVRFDIGLAAVEAGGLRISSRLLAVARKVQTGAG